MKKLFVLLVAALVAPLLFAGADHPGDFRNVTLEGTATIRVHQWLDISSLTVTINQFDIYDYDATYTYDPGYEEYINTDNLADLENKVAAFIVYTTNADLEVKVTAYTTPVNVIGNGLLSILVRFYRYVDKKYFPETNWLDLDENAIITDYSTDPKASGYGDDTQIGLGFKLRADKDLPAGEYTLHYTIHFNPTVTFGAQNQGQG